MRHEQQLTALVAGVIDNMLAEPREIRAPLAATNRTAAVAANAARLLPPRSREPSKSLRMHRQGALHALQSIFHNNAPNTIAKRRRGPVEALVRIFLLRENVLPLPVLVVHVPVRPHLITALVSLER